MSTDHHDPLHLLFSLQFRFNIVKAVTGRFEGLPIAAIMAGASAVVSSEYEIFDDTAEYFATCLYENLLDRGMGLGAALLDARRRVAVAREIRLKRRFWATSVLWGNPWANIGSPRM